VWLVLVIYEKMRTINSKFSTEKSGNVNESSLELSRKESFKAGAMNSQLRSTKTTAESKLKPTGSEITRDVVFTKMDEMAMEVEKTSSASFDSKEKGFDVESKKLGKGSGELLKKKDDDTSEDVAMTKRKNANAKSKKKP